MQWTTPGASFSLQILGYQFPDAEGEPYDSNWLRVRIDAASSRGAWSVTDPCLLTDEVAALADWLGSLAEGRQTRPVISFLQPGLLLRLVSQSDGRVLLRVHFGAFFPPDWPNSNKTAGRDRSLDLPLSGIDLNEAEYALRGALRRFPERREG